MAALEMWFQEKEGSRFRSFSIFIFLVFLSPKTISNPGFLYIDIGAVAITFSLFSCLWVF